MSSLFKKLSTIDTRMKYGVYGWIRKAERELIVRHIPQMISCICILCFDEDEEFKVAGEQIEISKGIKRISIIKQEGWKWWAAFGTVKIHYMNGCKYEWYLDINTSSAKYVIGLTSSWDSNLDQSGAFWNNPGIQYLYFADGIYSTIYCQKRKRWKDYAYTYCDELLKVKLSMNLDLKKGEIRFIIDGEDQGIAHRNVEMNEDTEYRLMVALQQDWFYEDNSDYVEIISFTKK